MSMMLLAAAPGGAQVIPARAQMAATLGFHIILACFGIALPSIVLLAEFIGLRRRNEVAMTLARRWPQVMGVLVAVGAVTGTVLSFEMGLLWPGLMRQYGAVLGLPFGVEGLFFFLEAIFAGIYLWGWRRLPGWAHWWSGVPIAVSGILGAMAVIAVNSWMNTPGGFTQRNGRITSVDVWQVFFSRSASYEMPHMILAAYMVAGFGVASVYAVGILRGRRDRYHYTGFALGFVPAAIITPFQIFVGDTAARAGPSRTTSRSSSRPWSTWRRPPGRSRSGWAGSSSMGTSMAGSRSHTWTRCWSGSVPVPRSSAGTVCPRPTGHRWCG
jgi:cytochrome bd ubiquinol oxidase subunit I